MRAMIQVGMFVKADDYAHLEEIMAAVTKGGLLGVSQRAEELGLEQHEIDSVFVLLEPVMHIIPDSLEWS